MRYVLDPLSPTGVSKETKQGFKPYFAGGPGKPSLLDSVNGKHGAVQITAGNNVTIDNTAKDIIKISATGGGGGSGIVEAIVAGNNIDVDATDPASPIVSVESLTAADITDFDAEVSNNSDVAANTAARHAALTTTGEDYLSLAGQQITANPIDLDNLSATGTPSSSTFLRGDNTWAIPASGGSGVVETIVAGTNIDVDSTDPANPVVSVESLTPADIGLAASVAELDYVDGVTSAIQTQIDTKAPLASPSFTGTVTLPTGLTGVLRADSGVVSTDSDVTDLVSAASTTAQGKVELATDAETTTGTDTTRAITPANLTSQIGSRIQAYDADLATIAGLTATTDNFLVATSSAWASRTPSQARSQMGLGALATLGTINDSNWSGTDLSVANGGTGVSTLSSGNVLVGAGTSPVTTTKAAPSGDFVGHTDSQTLTNKTMSVTSNTFSDVGAAASEFGYEYLGRTTLGSAGDTVSLTSIPARKYLLIKYLLIPSGAISANLRFNNDSGSNYANRNSTDGAADATQVSQTQIFADVTANATLKWGQVEILNVSAQEKIAVIKVGEAGTAGAGNAPSKREATGKWANTSAQINRIDLVNTAAGDYAIGSELIVFGRD